MQFPCGQCGKKLTVPVQLVGQRMICLHCGHGVVVPEPSEVTLAAHDVAGRRCIRCGYRLDQLLRNACPECGFRFHVDDLHRAERDRRERRRAAIFFSVTILLGLALLICACGGLQLLFTQF